VTTPDLRDQLQAVLGTSYVLERELGQGGMATVFLALDSKHRRRVALKVLHPDLASALGPERFRREIELAAQLQHPHVLSVLDSGEGTNGLLWFTMPYVEGESLRDRLTREQQLPIPDALRIAEEAAEALDYAHRRGVIHRDIKPENILLTGRHAMVADFGIARALTARTTSGGATLTETGMSVGTPAYMSPEQASGQRELDGRTDIYSLGAVLYEMLAGEPPFTGPNPQAVIARRFTEHPRRIRSVRDTVPEGVERALDTALATVPADRFATAGDFAKALEAAGTTTAALLAAPVMPGPVVPPLAPPPAPAPAARVRRRIPVTAAALSLGFVIGGGALFAWRHHAGGSLGSADAGAATLAVLPFDNEGDSADAYFADGITDAVRGKLTSVPGLEVTAPASSGQYRHTTKTPQQIGQELGVRYLLVGKVRWAKAAGSANRVEVSPALIDATNGADKWEQPFDAPLTDVFQVQADIAGKVAQQLKIALTPASERTLAARPTGNLDAYDAYLRGREISQGGLAPVVQRRAAGAFREAVELDSTFALAWAGLADAYSLVFSLGVPVPAVGDSAHAAAAKALALAPDLPEAHAAMGLYYAYVATDIVRALAEDSAALTRAPNSVTLLSRAALAEQSLGHWQTALAHLQQAARLDPRDGIVASILGRTELFLRNYPAAQAEMSRALALEPNNASYVDSRAMLALAQGDLAGARAVIRAVPAPVDTAAIVAFLAEYNDLGWVLDSAYERVLLGLGPGAFDNDRANWAIVRAQQYSFRGDAARTRAYADTARLGFEANLKAVPNDAQQHVLLGLALAYMGRNADAVREGERAVALGPLSKDTHTGAYVQHQLVRIYILAGERDKALDELEPLLKIPYHLTPGWLTIDPNFAPLRGNRRFEKLITDK
jgi:TolB-like protein/tRNA A-37 threonylcarbamoyl transferase component Bud32